MDARAAIPALCAGMESLEEAIASGDALLLTMQDAMNNAASAGNQTALNTAEEQYMAGLEEHLTLSQRYESLRKELNRNICLYDYIVANQHNRAGAYAYAQTIS